MQSPGGTLHCYTALGYTALGHTEKAHTAITWFSAVEEFLDHYLRRAESREGRLYKVQSDKSSE